MVVNEFMCAEGHCDKPKKWLLFFAISMAVNAVFAILTPSGGERPQSDIKGLLTVNLMSMLAVPMGIAEQSPQAQSLEHPVRHVPSRIVVERRAEPFIRPNVESKDKRNLAQKKARITKNKTQLESKENKDQPLSGIPNNSNIETVEIINENMSTPTAFNRHQQPLETIQTLSLAANETPGPLSDRLSNTRSALRRQAGLDLDVDHKAGFSQARYRHRHPPPYPQRARSLGQQGTVVLHAQVMPSGYSGRLNIAVSSGHQLLDRAAVAAVSKWQFVPAYAEGHPVAHWVSVPVRFALQ